MELELQKRRQKYLQKNVTIYSFDFSNREEEAFLQKLSMNSMFAEPKAFFIKRAEALKTNSWTAILKSMALFNLSEKEILFFYQEKELRKSMEKELQKLNAKFIAFPEEEQEKI